MLKTQKCTNEQLTMQEKIQVIQLLVMFVTQ